MRPFLPAATACCLFGFAAAAAEPAEGVTVLSLSETAEAAVVPDLATAVLRAVAIDRDAGKAQQAVNERMSGALAEAKAVAGVTVAVDAYQVYQENRPPETAPQTAPQTAPWHAEQSMTLRARDGGALGKLAGRLQERGLLMTSQYFSVSADLRQDTRQRLVKEALDRLRQTATAVAQSMAMTIAGYRAIHVDGGQPTIRPVMAMAVRDAGPASAPGEQTLSLSVSAEVLLGRGQK